MKVADLMKTPLKTRKKLLKRNKKKNNPKKSKTTKFNSFIDVFGGMSGYMDKEEQAVQ